MRHVGPVRTFDLDRNMAQMRGGVGAVWVVCRWIGGGVMVSRVGAVWVVWVGGLRVRCGCCADVLWVDCECRMVAVWVLRGCIVGGL